MGYTFEEVIEGLEASPAENVEDAMVLFKEIANTMPDFKKASLFEYMEVDEQWILDSEDDINTFVIMNWNLEREDYLDLSLCFKNPEITLMGIMVSGVGPDLTNMVFWVKGAGTDPDTWRIIRNLDQWCDKGDVYVVLNSKIGFFCLNWTYNQMAQLMKMVV